MSTPQSLERKRQTTREWKARNPERIRESSRKYYAEHPPESTLVSTVIDGERVKVPRKVYMRLWISQNIEKAREHSRNSHHRNYGRYLRMRYGIELKEYEELRKKQNGRCAICGTKPFQKLQVDHNHVTGKVRGLLCGRCNLCLRAVEQIPSWSEKSLAYLKEHDNA